MYAFNSELRSAWFSVFKNLHHYLPAPFNQPLELVFEDDGSLFANESVLFAQTCGYPYNKRWRQSHDLIAVADFDIEGCTGISYSSWIITRPEFADLKLNAFANKTAVINNADSNSGMNVLRYAVSPYQIEGQFFAKVIESGSHLTSLQQVMDGQADIAAIDAVTWYFARQSGLVDDSRVSVIGQSETTTGLPFMMSKNLAQTCSAKTICDAMNRSLEHAQSNAGDFLRIKRFVSVNPDQFDTILELEDAAISAGYPDLM